MALLTKPCARSPRGCTRLIAVQFPSDLAARAYCSRSCAVKARIEAGWHPEAALTTATRRLGGRRGGRRGGLVHRRRALERASQDVEQFFTKRFLGGLTAAQRAIVRLLVARAYVRGRRIGYQRALGTGGYRRRAKQKGAAA